MLDRDFQVEMSEQGRAIYRYENLPNYESLMRIAISNYFKEEDYTKRN